MPSSVRVSIDDIRPGVACGSDIVDDCGCLLLSCGNILTSDYLRRLSDRSVTHISISPSDLTALTGKVRDRAMRSAAAPIVQRSSRRIERSSEPYSPERAARFAKQLDNAIDLIDEIGHSAITPSPASLRELCKIPVQIAEMLAEDSDQSLSSARSKAGVQRLSARCVQMSMLAMSTAIELDLPDSKVALVGTVGLLHDLGLFKLPEKLRDPATMLTFDEVDSYKSHPDLTTELLRNFNSVPGDALLLMSQVHELADGRGFPRGIRAHRFHAQTHLMSIVEVYLTLTNPGPGRPPVVPHDAIGFMLFQCRQGMFDTSAMRAFVNQMTLFSIGSLVKLDDGQCATVVRRVGGHFDEPVVSIEGAPSTELTMLSQSDRSIVAPICDEHNEMRIKKSLMPTLSLESMLRTLAN